MCSLLMAPVVTFTRREGGPETEELKKKKALLGSLLPYLSSLFISEDGGPFSRWKEKEEGRRKRKWLKEGGSSSAFQGGEEKQEMEGLFRWKIKVKGKKEISQPFL